MVLPRSSNYTGVFRAHTCRAARVRTAGQSSRQIGRRSYASGHHEGAKKASSDLPWIIGSVAVTIPSATWLWQQGPKKSDHRGEHGHGDHEEHEEHNAHEAKEETDEGMKENAGQDSDDSDDSKESKEGSGEEVSSDDEGESKDEKRSLGETVRNEPPNEITSSENKFTSGDEGLKEGPSESQKKSQITKSVDADADEGKKDGPSDNVDKGHEGEQKGTRITEGDKKRKAEDPRTNSMHPYMADERKSKKGEGTVDTAKITGTVDTNRKLR